jgi:cyclin-dependent kinase regulatory subunit CKS1
MDIDMSRRNRKPRLLEEEEMDRLREYVDSIHYSARYSDDQYEYRHVQLPKDMLKKIPADYFDSAKGTLKLLWEQEWRSLGITQVSLGEGLVNSDGGYNVLFHLSSVYVVFYS